MQARCCLRCVLENMGKCPETAWPLKEKQVLWSPDVHVLGGGRVKLSGVHLPSGLCFLLVLWLPFEALSSCYR